MVLTKTSIITPKDGKWDSFSESATLNAPLTLHTGIAQAGFPSYKRPYSNRLTGHSELKNLIQFLGVAFLLSNLRKICGKYITLVELKKQYQEKFDEMQLKAVQILDQCYKGTEFPWPNQESTNRSSINHIS